MLYTQKSPCVHQETFNLFGAEEMFAVMLLMAPAFAVSFFKISYKCGAFLSYAVFILNSCSKNILLPSMEISMERKSCDGS